MLTRHSKSIVLLFFLLAILGAYLATNRLKFSFDLQHFFPEGDDDLAFFTSFKERFEPDDNFLWIGIRREEGVFNQKFLENILAFSLEARRIRIETTHADSIDNSLFTLEKNNSGKEVIFMHPILSAQSLPQIEYPVRNPLTGFSMIPAIHIEDSSRYQRDRKKILQDPRLINNFISKDGKMLVVLLKTIDQLEQPIANEIIQQVKDLLKKYHFNDYHLLGKAYFMVEIMQVQAKEFLVSISISFLLALLTFFLLFRRVWGVIIAITSVSIGLMMFVGMLGVSGQTLDALALLYPIIMLIVGTSDVIHVMSKYIDELKLGHSKETAIQTTLKEIGTSIFLTSTTTAIGFLSLVSSRLIPIQNFGINAALGVLIAYISVILFTTAVLLLFPKDKIIKLDNSSDFWSKRMEWVYHFAIRYNNAIVLSLVGLVVICLIGIQKINCNTSFQDFLPKGAKVTEDFLFFDKQMSGFRPFEVALTLQGNYTIADFEVIQEIEKLENHYQSYPSLKSILSVTSIYKTIHQAYHPNVANSYALPNTKQEWERYRPIAKRMERSSNFGILVSKDKKHARISGKVLDLGADSINVILAQSNAWIKANINSSILTARPTGTNLVMDKNSLYIRDNLLQGLGFALLVISIIISLIYRNIKLLIISIIPNSIPLLIAGAIVGYWGIPFEAGVAIVFTIIFGIAIDDTIHLLSKFKLCMDKGMDTEKAIQIMLSETGKAISYTTIILFFGFLSLYFSSSPPSYRIGMVMSSTLLSALICDLLIIPIMLRRWISK